ncbi:MAG: hypothetical protein Q8K30_04880 [Candidatus Gracilibacteria bacterium]|nr:hypothetical protein [Candidatus Gracilibacteria bacterium]
MGLTDSLKGNNEDVNIEKLNNEDGLSKTSNSSDILTIFENDLVLITKKPLLLSIVNNLNPDNLNSSKIILGKLLKSSQDEKYDEVDYYLNELQKFTNNYEKGKTDLVTEAKQGSDEVKTDYNISKKLGDKFSDFSTYVFGSETYQSIKDIKIDGSVNNFDEFLNKLDNLKSVVISSKEYKNLNQSYQKAIITNLDLLSKGLEEKKDIGLDFLNEKFNGLAKQIDNSDEGNVAIDFGDGNIVTFKNKNEAYSYVKLLKEDAESQFQSFGKNISEAFGNSLLFIISKGLYPLTIPYKITKWETIDDMEENFANNAEWFTWTGDTIVGILTILASINYTETLWRRILMDNLAKMGLKNHPFINISAHKKDSSGNDVITKEKKPIRIDDFSKNQTLFGDSVANELRDEYFQRLQALYKLEDKLKTISDPKIILAFEKELINLKGYLNVNSDTFWLKSLSLYENHYWPRRLLNSFINSPSGWPTGVTLRDSATRIFNLRGNIKDDLNKGLSYVFDDSKVDIDSQGVIKVDGASQESKNIINLKNYIESLNISGTEKNILKERINDYTKSLKDKPFSIDKIKRDLLLIVNEKYLTQSEILGLIDKKLNSKYLFMASDNSDLSFKEKWDKFVVEKVKQGYGNIAPSSLTSGDSMLFKFGALVKSGDWVGSQADLDIIFHKIDNGKLELSDIWSRGKMDLVMKFGSGFVDRYGITIPEITELKSYGKNVKISDIDDILSKGLEYTNKLDDSKSIMKGTIVKNLRYIFDLNSVKFPRDKEIIFEKILDTLSKNIDNGTFNITGDKLKVELAKMYDGYLPGFVVKDILTKHQDYGININSLNNLNNVNVKNFLSKVEIGLWNGTIDDLNRAITLLNSNRDIHDKIFKKDIDGVLNKLVIEGSALFDKDFKNPKFGIFKNGKFDIESFRTNELELAKLYKGLVDGNRLPDTDFLNLYQSIDKGVDYTSDEFFKELNNVLKTNIIVDQNTTRSMFNELLVDINISELNKSFIDFDVKNLGEQEKIINNFKSYFGITDITKSNSIISLFGNKLVPFIEKVKEFEIHKISSLDIDIKKSELSRIISDIDKKDSINKLEDLEKELNDYIKTEKIDRNNPDIKFLIDDFETKINDKKTELDSQEKLTKSVDTKIDLVAKQKEISDILKPLQLELISRGEIEKSLEISGYLDQIQTDKGLKDFLKSTKSVINYGEYYTLIYNNGLNIRTEAEMVDLFKHIDFTKLPDGINNLDDLRFKIKSTTQKGALKSIEKAIKSLQITR